MKGSQTGEKVHALDVKEVPKSLERLTDKRVRWALEWLRNHDLTQPAPVGQLAKSVHLSSSRLRHLFKSELGLTITRYRKLLRLEKARDLLRTSFLEVKEIAGIVGFGDVSHFVRDYKMTYGETPTETRLRDKVG
jgi:AraC family transcriptional regulator of arabinose operon